MEGSRQTQCALTCTDLPKLGQFETGIGDKNDINFNMFDASAPQAAKVAPLAPQASTTHGPADPLHPICDVELLTLTTSGISIMRQAYADGFIYEYQVPNGVSLYPEMPHLATPLFQGRLLRTFVLGESNYITVWMPELAPTDFEATPESEYESLHQDETLTISRLRFPSGWVYRVHSRLGQPWPRLACIAPAFTAPVVAMDRTELDFTVRLWVSDDSMSAEAAVGPKAGGYGWTKIRDSRSGSSTTFRRYWRAMATSSLTTNESDTEPSEQA